MKPSPTPATGISCPACGDSSSIISHGKRYAVYPSGCVLLGGIILPMLHQASSPVDYECGKCGKKFGIRSSPARIALILLILFLACIVAGLVAAFMSI